MNHLGSILIFQHYVPRRPTQTIVPGIVFKQSDLDLFIFFIYVLESIACLTFFQEVSTICSSSHYCLPKACSSSSSTSYTKSSCQLVTKCIFNQDQKFKQICSWGRTSGEEESSFNRVEFGSLYKHLSLNYQRR